MKGVNALFLKYLDNIKENEIILSSKLKLKNNIVYKKILLHVGYWKKEVSVKYLDNFPSDNIGLSNNLFKDFKLPELLDYKIRFEDRNIYVGPIISLLFVTHNKTLTPKFLSAYKCYLLNYNKVKGLIFIASCEGINTENKTFKGYYYDPNSTDTWIEGVFPYPDAVYRRVGIPENKYKDLILNLGDKIFNTYFFNKWELWKCLSPYEEIKNHLPHTEKLTDTNLLIKMLENHESVYLKKIFGEKSIGIFNAKKTENGFEFIDRVRKKQTFATVEEVSTFIKEITKKYGTYIIQQGVKAKRIENRSFDMRVVLQKDENKEWSLTSIIARFGGTGSITSNIGLKGMAKPGLEALKLIFNINDEEALIMQKDIINICSKACYALDKSIGHYGDLGIDVIIDENRKIWILEINKLHYHPYPVYALNDRKMYHDIASKPLLYANALAGF